MSNCRIYILKVYWTIAVNQTIDGKTKRFYLGENQYGDPKLFTKRKNALKYFNKKDAFYQNAFEIEGYKCDMTHNEDKDGKYSFSVVKVSKKIRIN